MKQGKRWLALVLASVMTMGASPFALPVKAANSGSATKGLGTEVDASKVVTEKELQDVNYVLYAVNCGGNVTDKTKDIESKPYPYANSGVNPQQGKAEASGYTDPGFPDALIGGKTADKKYEDNKDKLDWGYVEDQTDNPALQKGNANDNSPFGSWRQTAVKIADDPNSGSDDNNMEISADKRENYDENGGVVYRFEMPKRETGAANSYNLRVGLFISGNQIPYVKIISNQGKASERVLRENFPIIGNVKHILTFEDVQADENGIIEIKVQNNFKLCEPQAGSPDWIRQMSTNGDASNNQNARISFIEISAEPVQNLDTLKAAYKEMTPENALKNADKQVSDRVKAGEACDGEGTADYDSVEIAAADAKKLDAAREAAKKVIDDSKASDKEIWKAYTDLKKAYDVGYNYHYTAVPGLSGARQYASNGVQIQAHGGQIQEITASGHEDLDGNKDGKLWMWCGEDKTNGTAALGVHLYLSDDMYNWKDMGLILQTYQSSYPGQSWDDKVKDASTGYDNYTVEKIQNDPDYKLVYGENLDKFQNDLWNHHINGAEDILEGIKFDLDVDRGCIFERPKMIQRPDGRWVIWFHCEGSRIDDPTSDAYSKARAGVAISEGTDLAGPYKLLGSFRLESDKDVDGQVDDWGNGYGQVRDMNLYVDKGNDYNHDGCDDAYVIYTADGNGAVYASLLDASYTTLAAWTKEGATPGVGAPASGDGTLQSGTKKADPNKSTKQNIEEGATYQHIAGAKEEAPAIIKNKRGAEEDGSPHYDYYLITSGTSGWAPSSGRSKISGNGIFGTFTGQDAPGTVVPGDMTKTEEAWSNFISQSSALWTIDEEKGIYGYMGNQWFNPDGGYFISDSRYVIEPVKFVDGQMNILGQANWTPDGLDNSFEISQNDFPKETTNVDELMATLNEKFLEVNIRKNGEDKDSKTPVKWEKEWTPDYNSMLEKTPTYTGTVEIVGYLTDYQDAKIKLNINVVDPSMNANGLEYFIDCGNITQYSDSYYNSLKAVFPEAQLLNDKADQLASEGSTWGLLTPVENGKITETASELVNSSTIRPENGASLQYKITLPKGGHNVKVRLNNDDWYDDSIQSAKLTLADEQGTVLCEKEVVLDKNSVKDKPKERAEAATQTAVLPVIAKEDTTMVLTIERGSQTMHDRPAPVVQWIAAEINNQLAEDTIVEVEQPEITEDQIQEFQSGATPESMMEAGYLPKTAKAVTLSGKSVDAPVKWAKRTIKDKDAFQTIELTGTFDNAVQGLDISYPVKAISPNMLYYIDNGREGTDSAAYTKYAGIASLLNTVPDQKSTGDSWGYLPKDSNSTDIQIQTGKAEDILSSWIQPADGGMGTMSYRLPITEAGTYYITAGMGTSGDFRADVYMSINGEDTEKVNCGNREYATDNGTTPTEYRYTLTTDGAADAVLNMYQTDWRAPRLAWIGVVKKTDALNVTEIQAPGKVSVDYGTAFESLGLPTEVNVKLDDGTETTLPVTWSAEGYDGNTAGTYTIQGQVTADGEIANPDNLTTQIEVDVKAEETAGHVFTDEQTGITLEVDDSTGIPVGSALKVTLVDGEQLDGIRNSLKDVTEKFSAYNIRMIGPDGNPLEMNRQMRIKFPVPAEYNSAKLVMYGISEDGNKNECQYKIQDGKAILATEQLGTFAVGEKISDQSGDGGDTPGTDGNPGSDNPSGGNTGSDNGNASSGNTGDNNTGKSKGQNNSIKTGDTSSTLVWVLAITAAAVVGGGTGVYRLRKKQSDRRGHRRK